MAQSFVTQDGITLIVPGTVVSVNVQANQGNIATSGVLTLIGEASQGPGFLAEANLGDVAYTPDQYGKVIQKYGSGRLVDAFRAAVSAANDPNIAGAVSLIRMIKTNQSVAASGTASRSGFGSFASITARQEGAEGNLIRFSSAALQAEVAPTTGLFTYTPRLAVATSFDIRANGGQKDSATASAKMSAPALKAAIEDLAKGIMVKGGAEKLAEPTAGLTLAATAPNASTLVVTLQAGSLWANTPAIGDTAVIPALGDYGAAQNSSISGVGQANAGTYIVTDISNTLTLATLTLKKIETVGALVAASGVVSADKRDLVLFSQMEIKNITGQDRLALVGVAGTYNCTSNDGLNIKLDLPAAWAAQPKAGDILKLTAALASITAGFYQVSSSTATSISAYRISDGSAGTTGSQVITGPITALNQPALILAPIIDGLGKTLCVEGSVDLIMRSASGAAAGLSNAQKASAAELKNQMTFKKGDSSESFKSGGDIVLMVGCAQDDAEMIISATGIDFKVSGNLAFQAPMSQFKTLSDLAAFISSQTDFSAQVSLAKFNSINPAELDKGSFKIGGIAAHKNGRIKRDASDFAKQNAASTLTTQAMVATAGLPEASAESFLTGGAKSGTTSAMTTTAIDACEKLDTNFIVPLFSVDADADIATGDTESSSTYSVDAINAYLKAHVIKMSAIKIKKNRVALVSKRAAYEDCKNAAGEMASFRVGMCIQDAKNVASDGTIKVFQPWLSAVIAAGMQAAAGYKGIVKKFANVTGISMASGDFDANSPGDQEDALKSGILFMERVPTGGFRWVSDQLTYSIDNNFVYNSLQAVYLADLISLTLIERFDRLVVGKSVAEISATAALSILEAEMFNFKRLRWITASDDAIKGYKNAFAKLNGGVMEIEAEIKLAGLIYMVPIAISISQVTQTATQAQ